ncbi:MAG: cation diffusion facilitator family transporter [Candidatus Cloacimonetes bacterium]|nr:cation diffusion facilitator family transporter [Candidatus Cloacimonadota bacterium]
MSRGASVVRRQSDVRIIRRVTWVGLAMNLLLAAVKLLLGLLGNSQALVADAVHSLSDVSTDLAIIFGVRYWTAPADEEHPYGHAKFETIITAGIALLMCVVAVGIGWQALHGFFEPRLEGPRLIALWGAAVSIVVKEWLYHWTAATGRRLKSSALVANAWHHRTDAISSVPVLVAVLASAINPRLAFLDHLGAVLVSLFILWSAGKLLVGSLHGLTDHGADSRLRKDIHRKAAALNGVLSAHAIRTRILGHSIFVDLHIMVNPQLSVREGHDISEQVKAHLLDTVDDLVDVIVHLEPFEAPADHID